MRDRGRAESIGKTCCHFQKSPQRKTFFLYLGLSTGFLHILEDQANEHRAEGSPVPAPGLRSHRILVPLAQNLKPKIPSQRSRAKDPKPKIPNQKSQIKDSKPKILSQVSQAKNPKPKIRSQRSQAKDARPRIPSQRSQARDPSHRAQVPKPEIPSQSSKAKDPERQIPRNLSFAIVCECLPLL